MADKTPKTWTLEDIRQREKELEEAKEARIQDLIGQRKAIDAELAELGHTDGTKPQREFTAPFTCVFRASRLSLKA